LPEQINLQCGLIVIKRVKDSWKDNSLVGEKRHLPAVSGGHKQPHGKKRKTRLAKWVGGGNRGGFSNKIKRDKESEGGMANPNQSKKRPRGKKKKLGGKGNSKHKRGN